MGSGFVRLIHKVTGECEDFEDMESLAFFLKAVDINDYHIEGTSKSVCRRLKIQNEAR